MRLLLVSYDLRAPGRNYEGVITELKGAISWWHYLESTWLIRTNLTMEQWNDRLLSKMDKGDSVLMFDVTGCKRQGWLAQKAWDWIRDQNAIICASDSQNR